MRSSKFNIYFQEYKFEKDYFHGRIIFEFKELLHKFKNIFKKGTFYFLTYRYKKL